MGVGNTESLEGLKHSEEGLVDGDIEWKYISTFWRPNDLEFK